MIILGRYGPGRIVGEEGLAPWVIPEQVPYGAGVLWGMALTGPVVGRRAGPSDSAKKCCRRPRSRVSLRVPNLHTREPRDVPPVPDAECDLRVALHHRGGAGRGPAGAGRAGRGLAAAGSQRGRTGPERPFRRRRRRPGDRAARRRQPRLAAGPGQLPLLARRHRCAADTGRRPPQTARTARRVRRPRGRRLRRTDGAAAPVGGSAARGRGGGALAGDGQPRHRVHGPAGRRSADVAGRVLPPRRLGHAPPE